MRWVLASCMVALLPSVALATPPEPTPALEIDLDSSHWRPHWERVDAASAVIIAVAEGAAFAVYFAEPVQDARWIDRLPGDDDIRSALRIDDQESRELAIALSDAMFGVMVAWPIAVDALLIAGAVHGDTDMMLQMTIIDLEVLAVAHMITWLTSRLTGRVRPEALECAPAGTCADQGVGPVASFVGGHSLMAYASAGLMCTHHLENPWLLGGVEGAGVACAGGLVLATATSFLRVGVDRHWASDVAIGSAIGAALGFGMPYLLHYGRSPGSTRRASREGARQSMAVHSLAVHGGVGNEPTGLTLVGAF